MKRITLSLVLALLFSLCFAINASAAEYTATVDGVKNTNIATNTSYKAKTDLKAGSKVEIISEQNIASFYIVWYKVPGNWTVNDTKTIDTGFLHEYVELETPTKSFTITSNDAAGICFIKAFAEGETIPDDIQRWNAPQEKTDVMVFSAHADDESLFLGGAIVDIIANHPDANVQLVYMTNHIATECFREHERLDALWTLGIRNYPIVGEAPDAYSMDSLEAGLKVTDYDKVLASFLDLIVNMKPQVVITQDFKGEYGHGQHMVMAKAVAEAVEKCAADGTHDVAKTYIHLYKDSGAMELDLRQPLDAYGGMTALDVAKEAYKKHVSQQWCWFYVSDDYKYSCDEFGLYRTTVGADTGKDMLENIKTYKVQDEEEAARLAEEAARQAELDAQELASKDTRRPTTGLSSTQIIILSSITGVFVLILFLVIAKKKNKKTKYVPKHSAKDRGQTIVKK